MGTNNFNFVHHSQSPREGMLLLYSLFTVTRGHCTLHIVGGKKFSRGFHCAVDISEKSDINSISSGSATLTVTDAMYY